MISIKPSMKNIIGQSLEMYIKFTERAPVKHEDLVRILLVYYLLAHYTDLFRHILSLLLWSRKWKSLCLYVTRLPE